MKHRIHTLVLVALFASACTNRAPNSGSDSLGAAGPSRAGSSAAGGGGATAAPPATAPSSPAVTATIAMAGNTASGGAGARALDRGDADAGVTEPTSPAGGPDERDAGVTTKPPVDLRCKADLGLPQRTDYAKAGPHAVGTFDVTFEDTSRPIVATDRHPAASSRVLVTTIYYPVERAGASTLAKGGPFPLLIHSHGYSSGRSEAGPIAKRAASYGYIIAAPDFPLTNLGANGGAPDVNDAANQPGDVSYLLDQLLALAKDPNHQLAGGIDSERIGALGVSLGGLTTLLVTFHPRFQDPRIKVSMPIAALSAFFAPEFYHTREVPMLLVHGDIDAFIDYETNARRSFERAAPNARLITVAKGTHAAFGASFDPTTLPVLIELLGAPSSDPSNADGVGCGAVAGTLNMTGPEFVNALGDEDDFVLIQDASGGPCNGDEYKQPALDPQVQEDIAVRSATAFFEAHLGATAETRQEGCRYLLAEMPKYPAVTLE